jgi:hypothetical protein
MPPQANYRGEARARKIDEMIRKNRARELANRAGQKELDMASRAKQKEKRDKD